MEDGSRGERIFRKALDTVSVGHAYEVMADDYSAWSLKEQSLVVSAVLETVGSQAGIQLPDYEEFVSKHLDAMAGQLMFDERATFDDIEGLEQFFWLAVIAGVNLDRRPDLEKLALKLAHLVIGLLDRHDSVATQAIVALGPIAEGLVEIGSADIGVHREVERAAVLGRSLDTRLEALEILLMTFPSWAVGPILDELASIVDSGANEENGLELVALMRSYPQPEFKKPLETQRDRLPANSSLRAAVDETVSVIQQVWSSPKQD